jgi:Family of unknown function (DUF5996)
MKEAPSTAATWPALALNDWQDTFATLHLWTQIVGKTRLAFAPMQNHWWQVVFLPTARGLIAPAMPVGERMLEVEFDFIDHRLVARTSDGRSGEMPLAPRSVAAFYAAYLDLLAGLDVELRYRAKPTEMVEAIPFAEDHAHASYDPDAAQRCWRVVEQSARVFQEFRGRFVGKCSPVHFWWGGFDLACTRFSGRTAPPHPGGFPNLADWVTREAYSHECISAGWWPGIVGGPVAEPAYYAYAYPEPAGCPEAPIRPAEAFYQSDLREWVLPYDAVRRAADPDGMLLEFLQSTYEVAANLGGWDRKALERP